MKEILPLRARMAKSKVTPETAAIGARIAKLAEARGLTGEGIAKSVGLGTSSGNAMKSGAGLQGAVKLAKIAQLLGTTPNDLLGIPSSDGPPWERVRATLEAIFASLDLPDKIVQQLTEAGISTLQAGPLRGMTERDSAIARIAVHFEQVAPPKLSS